MRRPSTETILRRYEAGVLDYERAVERFNEDRAKYEWASSRDHPQFGGPRYSDLEQSKRELDAQFERLQAQRALIVSVTEDCEPPMRVRLSSKKRDGWRKLPPWNPFRLVWAVFDLWLPERKDHQ